MAREEKLIEVLTDVSRELSGIRRTLLAMWHKRYKEDKASPLSPELFTDEFITIKECARRLSVKGKTIECLIAMGLNGGVNGWKEGYHYVVIPPTEENKHAEVRIPWNTLLTEWLPYNELNLKDIYNRIHTLKSKELADGNRYDELPAKTDEE
jgi:hypothetical protein